MLKLARSWSAMRKEISRPREGAAGGRVVSEVDAQALERGAERAADAADRLLDAGSPVAAREPLDRLEEVRERRLDALVEAPGRVQGDRQHEAEPQQCPILAQELEHGSWQPLA
jgi:hypothetical protein